MALKGTTRIELTNVKTGEREVIEKDNLVTNAVADFLTMNPDGCFFKAGTYIYNNLLPACPNLFGGILLYENALDEDPNKYFAPDDNHIVGYSSNDVNGTTDEKRGSMNLTESGALEDGSGYRFIFDFSTSQANGTISAVGLTSKWGGISGYGSELSSEHVVKLIDTMSVTFPTTTDFLNAPNPKYTGIVSIDPENDVAYFAYVAGAGLISLGKITVDFNKIGLAKNIGPNTLNVLETTSIATETFCARSATDYTRNYAVCDDGDGYIWFFEHKDGAVGNSSGNATINYVKISKADWSFTEGTFTVEAQLYRLGRHLSGYNNATSYNSDNYAIVKDGFLYCLNNTTTAVVKIDLGNPTNVAVMENPSGAIPIVISESRYGSFGVTEFNVVGNIVYFPGGYIEGNEIYPAAKGADMTDNTEDINSPSVYPKGLKGGFGARLHYGPFMFMYDRRNLEIRRHVYLMTPYLATINNLPTPVQKTADKTMKITYILREEM